MPELPEVETIRIQLARYLVGESVSDVLVKTPKLIQGDVANIIGSKIQEARRFSKLLVIDFSNQYSLAVHLKMTGRLIVDDPTKSKKQTWEYDYPVHPHTHVTLLFQSGKKLYYHDYRRFGVVDCLQTSEVSTLPYIKSLGKEFFSSLTEDDFIEIVGKSNRAIKVILLDQSKMGGVGNIYANEGLWDAHIHPEQPGKSLTIEQKKRLFHSLEEVMKRALEYNGASSDNFRDLFGDKGTAQDHFLVYGKKDSACPRCSTRIKKYFLGGRGTYLCEVCQRMNSNFP